ncbi:hypothetical protein L210DRAFT_2218934 [Boletus edulis BED1]|uniref:Uncharacterized protein n=1 Tax=Boletus edulis BED1 TaxID=1328754 RepID=A0AAD4BE02_BOLED|nr:hypothetical protein L210DRAFT_2218934 [Boletus edulis BED1]
MIARPYPSILTTHQGSSENRAIDDEASGSRSLLSSGSRDCGPVREHSIAEESSMPKCRKLKNDTSISSRQKDRVREADPNQGRCLITNRPTPVDICHLVQAIDDDMLTELEYVSTSSSILIPGEIFSICKRTGTVSLTSIPNGC